jgi:site-specific recombinase XerD
MVKRKIIARRHKRENRETCWRVHVPADLISKEAHNRYFADKKDADAFARSLTDARNSPAAGFFRLPVATQNEFLRWLETFGGDELTRACRHWQDRRKDSDLAFSQVVTDLLAVKKQSGVRANSLASLKCSLNSLAETVGGKSISLVTHQDIESWLKLHNEWTPKTKLNRINDCKTLYSYLKKRQIVDRDPTAAIELPRVSFKGVKILSVNDCEKLLQRCHISDPKLLGFVAPVLFGGLRVAESKRCRSEYIRNGVIDLGGENTKLGVRRCVPVTPQLAAWLEIGELGGKNIWQRFRAVCNAAKVVVPDNALRHSFCSYSIALNGFEATARAANNSPAMLNKHYANYASKEDAAQFFAMRPTA